MIDGPTLLLYDKAMFDKLISRSFLNFLAGFVLILAFSFLSIVVVSAYASEVGIPLPALVVKALDALL